MDRQRKRPELELSSEDSVRFGMLLVTVSVVWGILVALLPAGLRTTYTIATFMLPLLIGWEFAVITVYALLKYRERVFGRLVSASTNLAAGVVFAIADFSLVGLFFMFQGHTDLGASIPGGVQTIFAAIVLVGVVGYFFIYRSVRQLLATTR